MLYAACKFWKDLRIKTVTEFIITKAADLLVLRFLRIDYGHFLTAFPEKESH